MFGCGERVITKGCANAVWLEIKGMKFQKGVSDRKAGGRWLGNEQSLQHGRRKVNNRDKRQTPGNWQTGAQRFTSLCFARSARPHQCAPSYKHSEPFARDRSQKHCVSPFRRTPFRPSTRSNRRTRPCSHSVSFLSHVLSTAHPCSAGCRCARLDVVALS